MRTPIHIYRHGKARFQRSATEKINLAVGEGEKVTKQCFVINFRNKRARYNKIVMLREACAAAEDPIASERSA